MKENENVPLVFIFSLILFLIGIFLESEYVISPMLGRKQTTNEVLASVVAGFIGLNLYLYWNFRE